MSDKTTNYSNAFITIASDYKFETSKAAKEGTIGAMQLDLLLKNPYTLTSDDLIFTVFANRNEIASDDLKARELFFAKPQACLRASPLVKTMGYGIHHNENSKIAVFPIESAEYKSLLNDENIKKYSGMRSKR